MKQLFLRSIKVKEQTSKRKDSQSEADRSDVVPNTSESEYDLGFDLEDYEQETDKQTEQNNTELSSIEGLKSYSLSFDNIVTYKEARTSIEEKRPFIVAKRGKKASVTEDIDTIYKTSTKMKISKNSQRVGFIVADSKPKKVTLNNKNRNKFKGIVNNEFLITKKKKFNHKKVGYLPLIESTADKELFVEVITNRGYTWLVAISLIMCLLGLIINTKDFDGWHFKKDNLVFYKTKEITEYKENELQVSLNATPVLSNGEININLESEKVDGITYVAKLYDENKNLVFKSDTIEAGEGIEKISLNKEIGAGEYEYKLICETYKNGGYIGEVESDIIIKSKTAEN
ncbi:MAG: hypothetical protein HDR05_12565 [Lachnospiraceae bacterium]|nr:hypothetical protein [Lachnospiraceae bacterium]